MRVISGSARGKQLTPVPGMDTRPTTDRVKESVFNILQTYVPDGEMLDLFAGTGQMGIEALSRGAAHAVFCDKAPKALAVIRKNIEAARVQDRAEVIGKEFSSAVKSLQGRQFDIIFLDPPYGGEILNSALKCIESFDILRMGGIILCESSVHDRLCIPDSFILRKQYKYGAIRLTSLVRADEE
ncbi:MAG: 16S rRNA (guanine(966)-N(2))-methyltransferase RsmD [Butyricicoccus sp.]